MPPLTGPIYIHIACTPRVRVRESPFSYRVVLFMTSPVPVFVLFPAPGIYFNKIELGYIIIMTETDIFKRWAESEVVLRVIGEETGKTEIAIVEESEGKFYLSNGIDAEKYPDDAWTFPVIKLIWVDEQIFISCEGAFFELDDILP